MSTPLPLGKYDDAWIIDAIFSDSDPDKPMVELIWRAQPDDTGDEVFTESSIHRLYGGAKDISERALRHFGWKPGDAIEVLHDFHGPIVVAERIYNGNTYREAKPFVPFSGARTAAADRRPPSVAKSRLAALFAPPGSDPLAGADGEDGDDIPF